MIRAIANDFPRSYWQFLLYLFISLVALELVFSPVPSLYSLYSNAIGAIGLSVEAPLPLPQIYTNYSKRSCKGFRLSVVASWIAGDMMKMFWFFSATTEIPWTFKMCGIFQMCCDFFLGGQYWAYGEGQPEIPKEREMVEGLNGNGRAREHSSSVSRRMAGLGEKDVRLG